MNAYMETLKKALDCGCEDAHVLLQMLYYCYREQNPILTQEIRKDFTDLNDILCKLPLRDNDRVSDLTCKLCSEHEQAAFFEGIRVAFQLCVELWNS